MTLVGEARAHGDRAQSELPLAQESDSTLQSKSHDITVGGHTDRAGEHAAEVERAEPRDFRQPLDIDGLVQVRQYVVSKALQNVLAQPAACAALKLRRMTGNQSVNEAARNAVPKK